METTVFKLFLYCLNKIDFPSLNTNLCYLINKTIKHLFLLRFYKIYLVDNDAISKVIFYFKDPVTNTCLNSKNVRSKERVELRRTALVFALHTVVETVNRENKK